jgi:hypothetical protein
MKSLAPAGASERVGRRALAESHMPFNRVMAASVSALLITGSSSVPHPLWPDGEP